MVVIYGTMALDGLVTGLLAEFIVAAIFAILALIYRVKILAYFQRLWAWLSNSEVRVHLTRIDKFDDAPNSGLGMDVFNAIKERYPDLENAGLRENMLRIRSDSIPTPIEIRLEEEHDFGDMSDDVVGYKLVIDTFSDLRFGYRTYGSLEEFEALSETTADIVRTECFTGQHPRQSFMLGELKDGIPPGVESIEDEDLNMSGSVENSKMQMTFRSPQNVTKGVRKYFRPT